MKRFPACELAFLCAPVALMAGLAAFLSRRAPPKSAAPAPYESLHLVFAVEKPSTLEGFKGADAVLVTRIKGTDAKELQLNSESNNR